MPTPDSPLPGDAGAILAAAAKFAATEGLSTSVAPERLHDLPDLVSVPAGRTLWDLTPFSTKYLKRPYRPTGLTTLQSVLSMLSHIARHATPGGTVVYVDTTPENERVTAIYDAHENGTTAGHQQFRSTFAFQQSEAWKHWSENDNVTMDAATFAQFLDERIGDVYEGSVDGTPMGTVIGRLSLRVAGIAALVGLARELTVNATSKVKSAVTLSTGEVAVLYEETHADGEGAPIKIANAFLIAIPVFRGTPPVVCLVRLSYRLHGGAVTWKLRIHDIDAVHEFTVQNAVNQIRAGVGDAIPVFEGVPSAAEKVVL